MPPRRDRTQQDAATPPPPPPPPQLTPYERASVDMLAGSQTVGASVRATREVA
ncbi:hypothetical protein F511_46373 [Dorcoceras hygrometricum]|uniref:Uncharacterized protein n=1 Tax=Dorcoceras hygrometricum TaxID=472368 RepID=A0A2Z6ZUT2_9LAMI|nr:hypothetical protein F511_46373 [Dorcoceras hygrometricum]